MHQNLKLPGVLVCLFLLMHPAPALSQQKPDLFARVLALEDKDQLQQALQLLQTEDTKQEYREHRQNLEAVLRAFQSTGVYIDQKQPERARAMLDGLLQKLDPIRDAGLLTAVQHKLTWVEDQTRPLTDATVSYLLAKAEAQLKAKKYDDALATFSDVAGRRPGEVSEALLQQARQGVERAKSASLEAQNPGFWPELGASLAKGLLTIAQWLVYFGAVALVVGAVVLVPRVLPPHKEISLALTDLTASATDRAVLSQSLMQEMADRIRTLGQQPAGAAELDWYEDLDNASLGNLRVQGDDLAKIDALIDDTAVHVGVVAFSPRQLFNFLRLSLRRPYRLTLRGSLEKRGDQTSLTVEGVGKDGKPEAGKWWQKESSGANARAEVVLRVAWWVAFDLAEYKVTANRLSFESYQEGVGLLGQERSADREARLQKACEAFQQALRFDQANWMARFNCATVLRKLGQNEPAAEQFAFLERMLEGDDTVHSRPLTEFLNRHPDFPDVVRYNRVVALSKSVDRKLHQQAHRLVEELIQKLADLETIATPAAMAQAAAAKRAEAQKLQTAAVEARAKVASAREEVRQARAESRAARRALSGAEQALQQARQAAGGKADGDEAVLKANSALAEAQTQANDTQNRAQEKKKARAEAVAAALAAEESARRALSVARQWAAQAARDDLPEVIRRETHLAWLARSALAALFAHELEYLRDQPGDANRLQSRRNKTLDRIEELQHWAEDLPAKTPDGDWHTYALVQCVIQNALGRAYFLVGRYKKALDILLQIINTSPAFLDAYVNLAQVYLEVKERFYPEWVARTENVLQKAISLSPTHQKAHYLLAKLYAEPGVQQYAKAKEELDKAGSHPANDALRALILHEENHRDEALLVLKRSLALFSKPDYRFGYYVEYLLESAGSVSPDPRKLEEALAVAKRLKDAAMRPAERKWGRRLVRRIEAALAARQNTVAGESADPSKGREETAGH